MARSRRSHVYVIAGPNGAGKTTFAGKFLAEYADCPTFINADLIAARVSPRAPSTAAFRAGRIMLREIRARGLARQDFGFETTLSGKSHLLLLANLKKRGYAVHLFFLWIPNVTLSLRRIRMRVREGGHDVPARIVRRRFSRSAANFFGRYRRIADSWMLFDNSGTVPALVAFQRGTKLRIINSARDRKIAIA